LADVDLAPLGTALEQKEIVFARSGFRSAITPPRLNFAAQCIFDTVIGARLLGIREFSLAAW